MSNNSLPPGTHVDLDAAKVPTPASPLGTPLGAAVDMGRILQEKGITAEAFLAALLRGAEHGAAAGAKGPVAPVPEEPSPPNRATASAPGPRRGRAGVRPLGAPPSGGMTDEFPLIDVLNEAGFRIHRVLEHLSTQIGADVYLGITGNLDGWKVAIWVVGENGPNGAPIRLGAGEGDAGFLGAIVDYSLLETEKTINANA